MTHSELLEGSSINIECLALSTHTHIYIFVLGTPVLKVTATDVDAGVNAQVKYEMVDSPKSPTDTDLFRIGITDGQVATNVGRAVLDREVQDQYKVIVRAYDGGIPRHEGKL